MIELKNASKTYQMGSIAVKALRGVSLRIDAGEFVAIMGPSGSGKSTLMHVLGLLDRMDSGNYYLGKQEVSVLSDEDLAALRNRFMGFVFQQFHLLPRMTALDNVALPLIYSGKRYQEEKVKQEIGDVGLSDRVYHKPNELSGGQQQRVAIARALINSPLIILADEPTGNLDSKSKQEIMAILRKLNERGKTLVVVTHEQEVAQQAKRIIRMIDGQIVSDEKLGKPVKISHEQEADAVINHVLSKTEKASRKTEFLDYVRQAGRAMLSHRMRSFLSVLGILIGVAAVIAMLAVGQGAKDSLEKQLASLGSNLLVVRAGSPKVHGVAMESGATRFTFQDVNAIEKLTDVIARVSPSVRGRGQMVYANKNWNTAVEGVGEDYAQMRASVPVVGRFFTEEEIRMRAKVVILGTTVVKELFGEKNPVGESVKINRINFKVIGISPVKGANPMHDQDDTAIIPVTTAMFRVFGKEYVDSIFVEAKDAAAIDPAQEKIKALLAKLHRVSKEAEEDSFEIRNMSDIKSTMESMTKTMSLLLGAIAAISLLVGGIGIMNIMLVSVTERTREIGLRKAIGANNKDIMVQFLIEAVLMSFIGGICGIVLGGGVSWIITLAAGWTVKVSLFSVLLSTIFSLVVGVVFGLWPAKQASELNPIEALRYE